MNERHRTDMPRVVLLAGAAALLVVYPLMVPEFWTLQIGAQSLILGIIALSLNFLAGYAGMISLAQMAIAGVAGYAVAYFGPNHNDFGIPLAWPYAMLIGLAFGTAFALLIGLVAVRTTGIYMLMITLAVAVGLYYFVRQNYPLLNGWDGFKGIPAPVIAGVDLRDPVLFYYLSLAIAAASLFAVTYLARTPFGLALQGIRDNARRMRTLGFRVGLHRVLAFGAAGFIAAVGGVLFVWYNGRISPGTIDLTPTIGVLVIAVIGGMSRPIGAFIGAVVFTLIQNFAIDLIDRERFNTLIGLTFLIILLLSPDGLLGIGERLLRLAGWARPKPVAQVEQPRSR